MPATRLHGHTAAGTDRKYLLLIGSCHWDRKSIVGCCLAMFVDTHLVKRGKESKGKGGQRKRDKDPNANRQRDKDAKSKVQMHKGKGSKT